MEQSKSGRTTTKSVPNLRTAKESHRLGARTKASDNSQSFVDAGEDAEINGLVSKLQRNLGKRLFRPAQKEVASKTPEDTQAGPGHTLPRTLKVRSVSMEHLKSLCSTRKTQQQSTTSKLADLSTRRDALKNQVLNYLSSDKVTETWETMVKNEENSRYSSQKKIDWPLSIFRGRSSTHPHAPREPGADILKDGLGGEMTWLEKESENLNTYPLRKPKPDISPRIHVISVQQTLVEGEELNASENENAEAETGSMVTALP